jgi:hypothetical protein
MGVRSITCEVDLTGISIKVARVLPWEMKLPMAHPTVRVHLPVGMAAASRRKMNWLSLAFKASTLRKLQKGCRCEAGSYEALFHATRLARFLLTWREDDTATEGLRDPGLERAIGVIYRPETERGSHYFWARLAREWFERHLMPAK